MTIAFDFAPSTPILTRFFSWHLNTPQRLHPTHGKSALKRSCPWVHTVIVATLRNHSEKEEVQRLLPDSFPVVYCCRKIKAGYNVDIWVDDMPEF